MFRSSDHRVARKGSLLGGKIERMRTTSERRPIAISRKMFGGRTKYEEFERLVLHRPALGHAALLSR